MTAQLYNGLVIQDSAFYPQPMLAKAWEISSDGLEYRFFLRNDVFFHQHSCFGEKQTRKVVASDFVYSFTRLCDPATAAKGAWIFNGKVRGLEPFRNGDTNRIAGFDAPDDTTFVIQLTKPFRHCWAC